jgi:hypothetical protein
MFSKFLLPESVTRQDGMGPEIELPDGEMEVGSTTLQLTLGITRILEKEILDVSVWGSADGNEWMHLAAFPRKSYCGKYSMVVDLTRHPGIRLVRAQWQMGMWDMQEPKPLFGFYLHAEDVKIRHAGAA